MMNLLSLPNEILSSLPLYIDDIKTFTNAAHASSCRRLRKNFESFAETHPKTTTARQVSRWALGNEENTDQLRKVFQKGINSLYNFCINNPDIGLTMEDIRRLHPASLGTELDVAAFQLIIYGELFASSMQAFLELDYFKYCIHNVEDPSVDRQLALLHILYCRRWRLMWEQAKSMIDRNFQGETEQLQEEDGEEEEDGLEGMQLVTLPKEEISKECRDQALQIKRQVELLQLQKKIRR
ncbi:hypothetical protein V8E54_004786 [Elaphomyces granulatus]